MKALAFGGCGCAGSIALFVLAVPLLFLGTGAGASSSGTPSAAEDQQVIAAGGRSCNAAVGCQPPPPALPYVPVGFFPDAYTNPSGECTSWSAALWPGHHGRGVTWSGDAWEWFADAATQGYAISASPSLGAIAVFSRTSGAGEWGHVAVVIGMTPTSMRLSEMNEVNRFVVDERTVSLPDPLVVGFIPVPLDAFT